ncbi:glutamate--cysteine ligase [Ponticoccus sp. SC2-23]|uniref:glutamate--cysteine ligase n=1 Tax=Alexandriicola marinus TaxID=2081710 RepID=UPI000FDAD1AD|nr:glutamate--cysteine ligase [Alexandriicola marinus]MBM1220350.1 glutamate--cysteine ligase [Ponticoccus sp. SC6-9]MBM1225036.1 glutamate--cysteine ligase [Ponticoccus sp. SC6-15]MBM1228550.1 glutamate--cysteine ligase [Ponticoccus sp. SC6-38]MBM1233813.1 glutamate--cysteine ligase [Ponticoccus sp. SC6-45]MBM1239051.1 glutamate--cysteine ligase [Ponticoccus sp. SC6-49]MBM1242833.1 glutamate--cysteine ligase [Ponticoccus sp. SC2-64]MBM1247337.1 glutamate--cysteine ligase [Ponticoccus sp. SC
MSIPQSGGGPIESHAQLAEFLEAGCKPREDWRIGTEHEKFGYCRDTLRPLPYEGERSILAVLSALRDRFGWSELTEGGKLIGLEKDGANISLEPGGQLELSGAPLETIHQTCDEVNQHLEEVKSVSDRIGVGFIGLGAAPIWRHEDMPLMPKGRYRLMDGYMQQVGEMGTAMMRRTCTVQVNLDFSSEADMVQKLRVSLALQPLATALFSNSPFFEGRPNGFKSWRANIWQHLDADRTGMLPFVFEDGFGFEAWADWVLDVPMYFVYRDGVYINALGQSFRDFLKGELPALPGETPLLSDWADHLTTVFPEARIKQFMEMRGADGGPWRRLCALPALWVGLLYDQTALDAAWDLVKGWDAETRDEMRLVAARDGLAGQVGGISMLELAGQVLEIAEAGLRARARPGAGGLVPDETHFLNALKESVASGQSPADELLEHYHGDWDGDLSRIYAEFSY